MARTSLIIGLFGATEATLCMSDEHEALVAAIEQHDGERAQEIMLSHLAHIENELELSDRTVGNVEIRAILRM